MGLVQRHPDKTRLIEFGRHAADHRKARDERKPETFDFLGFTHICGTTRKTGRFIVKRKTIRRRFAVPGNMDSLNSSRTQVIWRWYRAPRRRGRHRLLTWVRFLRLVDV